jgi:Kef-type K+ transport system membrane component KefB
MRSSRHRIICGYYLPAVLTQVLLALTAVIVAGQLLSRLLARIGQPPVIGEVLAGILLGPSLIGAEWSAKILAPAAAPALGVIAQLGVILYMFLVGLELHMEQLRRRASATLAISYTSMIVPFAAGSALALYLYPRLATPGVPFLSFMLFLGVALSITAFPVLARILTDRGLAKTEIGVIALSCAAIGDVTAWCLLALVVGVVRAEVGSALLVAIGAAVYIAVMYFVAKPAMHRFVHAHGDAGETATTTATLLVALLVSSLVSEAIGIHAIFGAFLMGAIVPSDSPLAAAMIRQWKHLVTVLLLPAFFAFTGMRTRIDLVSGAEAWGMCGLILLVAIAAKFGGASLAARAAGMPWRDSAILGALMNTRGLMELIVLNIGLELGVISPALFSMMVIMAVVTTMTAAPVLTLLHAEQAHTASKDSKDTKRAKTS